MVQLYNNKVSCGLVTFTEEILNGKLYFLCSGQDPFLESSTDMPEKTLSLRLKSPLEFTSSCFHLMLLR